VQQIIITYFLLVVDAVNERRGELKTQLEPVCICFTCLKCNRSSWRYSCPQYHYILSFYLCNITFYDCFQFLRFCWFSWFFSPVAKTHLLTGYRTG